MTLMELRSLPVREELTNSMCCEDVILEPLGWVTGREGEGG
eukprot:COSAG02_NODE_49471_length_326_cov_1.334802_1_plen_40_part_01